MTIFTKAVEKEDRRIRIQFSLPTTLMGWFLLAGAILTGLGILVAEWSSYRSLPNAIEANSKAIARSNHDFNQKIETHLTNSEVHETSTEKELRVIKTLQPIKDGQAENKRKLDRMELEQRSQRALLEDINQKLTN